MTVEASAANESGWLEAALASQALRQAATVALATGGIGIAASRLEPATASTPLISAPGRTYFLLALAITIVVTVVATGFNFNRRALLDSHVAQSAVLALGAATFLFASHRSPASILVVAALAGLTLYATHMSRQALPESVNALVWRAPIIIVLMLFIGGLLEFRLRTLYAAPVASLASVLALRQMWTPEPRIESKLTGPLVVVAVSTEMIWALGFLNISTWLAATIWLAAFLAVVYGLSNPPRSRRP